MMGKAAALELQNSLAVGCPEQKASSTDLLSSTMELLMISRRCSQMRLFCLQTLACQHFHFPPTWLHCPNQPADTLHKLFLAQTSF